MSNERLKDLYLREFPDYGEKDFTLPECFEDDSWHNNTCPSWMWEKAQIVIWCDYADKEKAEYPDMPRFTIAQMDDGSWIETVYETDTVDELEAYVISELIPGKWQQMIQAKAYEKKDHDYEAEMVDEYNAFLERWNLPHGSADEVLYEYGEIMHPAAREWINDFIARWEVTMDQATYFPTGEVDTNG